MSNRIVLGDREVIDGRIGGVNFGGDLVVLIRSPQAMLCWYPGGTYWSGRQAQYASSHFLLVLNRDNPSWGTSGARRDYSFVHQGGGRMSQYKMLEIRDTIAEHFGEDAVNPAVAAVRFRKTLIIEGGGSRLRPARKLGKDAYELWQSQTQR